MGYVFKEMSFNDGIFHPVGQEDQIVSGYSVNLTKNEKLKLLWLNLYNIVKSIERI